MVEACKTASKFSTKSPNINILCSDNDSVVESDVDKAELLNTFFASQSNIDESNVTADLSDIDDNESSTLESISLDPSEVCDILKNIDSGKASGPDKISPILLKKGAIELSYPLCLLFNCSLSLKIFPTSWKIANITPV